MTLNKTIITNPTAWLLLALSAFSLELSALYFQYMMDLKPCIMCVYQRLAIGAILISGVVGYVGCQYLIARLVAYVLWGVGAIWGLLIAIEHVEIQTNSGSLFYTCEFMPNFPTWAPLNEWIPFLFDATGDCGEINWQFLSYSMPQWMIVVYGLFTCALALVLLGSIFKNRTV